MARRFPAFLALGAAVAICAPALPLAAQRLRGQVFLPDSATPAGGVIVVATGDNGGAVKRDNVVTADGGILALQRAEGLLYGSVRDSRGRVTAHAAVTERNTRIESDVACSAIDLVLRSAAVVSAEAPADARHGARHGRPPRAGAARRVRDASAAP